MPRADLGFCSNHIVCPSLLLSPVALNFLITIRDLIVNGLKFEGQPSIFWITVKSHRQWFPFALQ